MPRAILPIVVALVAAGFASTSAQAYPDVVIENTTEYTVSGEVDYAGPGFICGDDDFTIPGKVEGKPNPTWSHSRGACLIIGISGSIVPKHGEKATVVSYDSTGTGYSGFLFAAYGGGYRFFSTTEYNKVTDTRQGKSPGFYFVNETAWPIAYSLDQVGCLYHGIVPTGTNGRPGIMKVDTGAVWFTLRAHIQPDGQNPQSDWDCVEPVADLVGDVLMAAASGGSAAAAKMGGKLIIKTVLKETLKAGLKKAGKEIAKSLLKDIAKEELGRLLKESGSVELYGQYAGYEWPFRCDNMPEYHITGGPELLQDENGDTYIADGPIFTVTKTNTCGDDMMLGSRKSQSAGRSFFASYDNPAAVATGNAGAGGAATLWKVGDIAEVRTPLDSTWRIATVQQFHPTDGILILYSDTGKRMWMPEKFMRPAPPGTVAPAAPGGVASQWKVGDVVEVQRPADGRWTPSSVLQLDPISGVFIRYQDTGEQMWVPQTIVRAPQQAAPGSQWKVGDVVEVQRPADGRWTPSSVLNLDTISGVFIRYQDTGEQMWVPQTIVRAPQQAAPAPGGVASQWKAGDMVEVQRPADGRWILSSVLALDPISGVLIQYQDTFQQMWVPQSIVRGVQTANVTPGTQPEPVQPANPHEVACQTRGQMPAGAGTQETIVNFANAGTGDMLIYWINGAGQETDYQSMPQPLAVIPPGQSQTIAAYVGHSFVIKDAAQTCLSVHQAVLGQNDVAFGPMAPGNGNQIASLGNPAVQPENQTGVQTGSQPGSQTGTPTPSPRPIDPQESAFDRDLSQRIAAQLFDRCGERGTVQSSNPAEDNGTQLRLSNVGTRDIRIFWIDVVGAETGQGNGEPYVVLPPGTTTASDPSMPHQHFIALDDQSNCVGIGDTGIGALNHLAFSADVAANASSSLQANAPPPDPAQNAGQSQAGLGCESRGQVVSSGGTDLTTLNFTNSGTGDMSVYWVDGQGAETDYGGVPQPLAVVRKGETRSVEAYIGHSFVVTDALSNCLAIVQAGSGQSDFAFATAADAPQSMAMTDSGQDMGQDGGATQTEVLQTDLGQGMPQTASGCAARGQVVSSGDTELASVSFTNNGSGDLSIYWIDGNGSETDYASSGQPLTILPPGQSTSIEAYVGHYFVAVDASSGCVGLIQAAAGQNDFAFAPSGESSQSDSMSDNSQDAGADQTGVQAESQGVSQTSFGCEWRGQLASSGGADPANVTFANTGSGDMSIYWIDASGMELGDANGQALAVVPAGQAGSLQASVGDAFIVVDGAMQCLGLVQAAAGQNDFAFAAIGIAPEGAPMTTDTGQPADANSDEYAAPSSDEYVDPNSNEYVAQPEENFVDEQSIYSEGIEQQSFDNSGATGEGQPSAPDEYQQPSEGGQEVANYCIGQLQLAEGSQELSDCYAAYPNYPN